MAKSNNAASKLFSGLAILGLGGLLFYYGRQRKGTLLGRVTTAAGMSLLLRALRNPMLGERLGPLTGLFESPLATAQKLLG